MQFALDGGLLGGGLREFVHILGERLLHILEGVPQLVDLVVVGEFGEFGVKVSFCHFLRGADQVLERLGGALDGASEEQGGDEQADALQQQDEDAQHHARKDDASLGNHHGGRPPRMLEGGVEDHGLDAVNLCHAASVFSGQHLGADDLVVVVLLGVAVVEVIVVQDAVGIRMHQVFAVAA